AVPHAEASGEAALELGQHRTQRQPARAQDLEHERLLTLAERRARQRDAFRAQPERAARVRSRSARPGSMPASSESTSASQLASMMFSETPIVPHVSTPSVESSRTRVTAAVPLRSLRIRTL